MGVGMGTQCCLIYFKNHKNGRFRNLRQREAGVCSSSRAVLVIFKTLFLFSFLNRRW
jgi:hypothetical protein